MSAPTGPDLSALGPDELDLLRYLARNRGDTETVRAVNAEFRRRAGLSEVRSRAFWGSWQ